MGVHLLVNVSDIHGGSTVAVCPPKGIELDDGGVYVPSRAQKWLWKEYVGAWTAVARLRDEIQPDTTTVAVNGDAVDGFHHPKSNAQYITPLESHHIRIAHKCLEEAFRLVPPDAVHMTRGTGSHVGKAGTLEEGLARVLREEGYPMVEDPDTGQVTSQWRRYEIGDLLIDQRHHGRMGQRAHTKGPYMRWYAQDIELEHRLDGETPPDIAIRAHNHAYGDSGRDHRWRTRVIAQPCWQLTTEYSHRRAYESLPSIGLVAVVIRDGRDEVIPFLSQPDRPTIIRSVA